MTTLSRVAKLAVGAGLALVVVGQSAMAQYYYTPAPRHYPAPQFYPQPGFGGYSPHPQYYEDDYRPRRRAPAPNYRQPGYYQPDYGYQRRVRLGSVCVTSRGACPTGQPVPIGTGCGCRIPNFGKKRGEVRY
ncbi:hypothetical protein MCEMSEM23_00463 [Rhabdaerophilaceae bacterium]